MSCSVNFPMQRGIYCPDWTLCSSIKVQNNTSVFQHWKGQWQLQSSARWLCILINQQGGSRLCFPPHAVWSGAWQALARPLLSPLWSWLNWPKHRATPHLTAKSQAKRLGTPKRKGFKGFTGMDSILCKTVWTKMIRSQETLANKNAVLMCQIPWIHVFQECMKRSGEIKGFNVVWRVSTWNLILGKDLPSGRV